MLKSLIVFLIIFANKADATQYKIGSKVATSTKEIEKFYNKLKIAEKNISFKEFKEHFIYVRSFVLSLKLSHQIPENYKYENLSGYEGDENILAQYKNQLKQFMQPSDKEIAQQRVLYNQIGAKKFYMLREIEISNSSVLSQSQGQKILLNYKKQIDNSKNKLKTFISLLKYSISKSAENRGIIGFYNPSYDPATAHLFENAKINSSIIIGNKLYFVEQIISTQISDEKLFEDLLNEKIASHINKLLLFYPIQVQEFN